MAFARYTPANEDQRRPSHELVELKLFDCRRFGIKGEEQSVYYHHECPKIAADGAPSDCQTLHLTPPYAGLRLLHKDLFRFFSGKLLTLDYLMRGTLALSSRGKLIGKGQA